MTQDDPKHGEAEQSDLVSVAEWHLRATATTLKTILTTIEAGDFGPAKDLGTTVSALRKALEAVFSERARLERIGAAQGVRAGDIDLGAARAEIRRRMDRLRAASDAGNLSGGAE